MKALLIISCALLIGGCSADVQKQATLILPEKIARSQNDAETHPAAEINWDEDETGTVDVEFDLSAKATREAIVIAGTWTVYNADNQEAVQIDADIGGGADPLRGTVLIRKGRIRLPFRPRHGNVLFDLKAGRYYAIASFSGSFRGRKVRFTTEKRWFEITDEH